MAKTTRAWKVQAANERKKSGVKVAEEFRCACCLGFYKGSAKRRDEHTQRCLAKREAEVAADQRAAEAAKEAANEP
uniref:Uncharacterized protein n=1 Tax=Oryza nivara TaxID=4536 RepID=A0A0E0J0V0_ORYNI